MGRKPRKVGQFTQKTKNKPYSPPKLDRYGDL